MKKIFSVILCSFLVFTLAGCERIDVKNNNDSEVIVKDDVMEEPEEGNTEEITEGTTEIEDKDMIIKDVVLYFSDDQAMYLVGEKRSLENPSPKSIMQELIKGPSKQVEGEAKLYGPLPSDLELLDIQVKEGIANVDIKSSSVEKISGGAAGEGMALYSIINTLVLDNDLGITKVQFLVDGKKVDTIKGHYDVSEPISEDKDRIKE